MQNKYIKGLCSICCLSYNHAKYIEECINSLWQQEYKNIEIIAVDDGSSDNSLELLYALQEKSPCKMQIIAQKNTGNIGKNFNTAFNHAQGEFVVYLAMDDFLLQDCISSKLKVMENKAHIAFIANTQVQLIDDDSKIVKLHDSNLPRSVVPTPQELDYIEYNKFHSFYLQGTCIRSEIIEKVGGFDEDMIADDIILRTKIFRYLIENQNYIYRIFPKAGCSYRIHDSNVHKNSMRQLKAVLEYLERYHADKENPEILYTWLSYTLAKKEDYYTLAKHNKRAATLLEDEKVIALMLNCKL